MTQAGTTPMPELARRIWRLLDAPQKRECALVLLVTIAAACFTVVGVAGIAPFFAVLADPTVIERSTALAWLDRALALQSTQALVAWLGIGFVALLFLSNLANFLAVFAISRFSHNVGARLHVLLFEEYLYRDIAFHTQNNSGMLETRIVFDVSRTVAGVIESGLTLIGGSISIGLLTVAVMLVDPVIAVGVAILLGASYAFIYRLVRRRLMRNGTINAELWGHRAKVVTDSLRAIKDIIVFRAQREVVAEVARDSREIAKAIASTSAVAASPRFVLESAMAAGLVATALWIYSRTGPGQWLTYIAFLAFATYRLLPTAQQVFTAAARVRSERASFERIADDLDAARRRAMQPVSATAASEWLSRPRREIRLVNVSYRHTARRDSGVDRISMHIRAGTVVGLVGPNGSGKTTLVDLILGLLEPDGGSIEIDGIALDRGHRDAWLATVAYVPQRIALLDSSVAENIAFGVPADGIDLERVREAAERARLRGTLDAMPEGLATAIGQDGVKLSGGQRQLIGIARALYRRASLLVMDEATSALDAATEAEIINMLAARSADCTTILIAHRQSALARCDTLFELDRGRLAGPTTFAELSQSSTRSRDRAETLG